MNNYYCQHILIFDSGFGGLSIAKEIHQLYPDCQISYLADNAFFPYGTKPDGDLTTRICAVIGRAVELLLPDLVVVACNTASTIVLAQLRQQFTLPFVGVVPAIKPAAAHSVSNTIGLLATPATVNRAYTNQLINDFAQHTKVLRYGSSQLVLLAEAFLLGEEPAVEQLRFELDGLLTQPGAENLDTVVLACTHFPLLKQQLKSLAPDHITWIDSGLAVARQVGAWLQKLAPVDSQSRAINFYHTAMFKQAATYSTAQLTDAIASSLGTRLPVSLCYFPD